MLLAGIIFFFQAEDGIRDLVRSRGLGDVYKRQVQAIVDLTRNLGMKCIAEWAEDVPTLEALAEMGAVSYTHLTLPTSDLV